MAIPYKSNHRVIDTQWDDIRIVPGAFDFPGNSDPSLADWQPGGEGATFKLYEFAEADEVTITVQLPHSYKQGTDLKPHVHWTPGDRGSEENGNTVAWKLDYTIISPVGIYLASTNVDLSDTVTGTDHQHELGPSGTISGTGLEVSSIMVGRLYRDSTGDTWATDTVGNRPMILEFDLHFEVDGHGSDTELAKN